MRVGLVHTWVIFSVVGLCLGAPLDSGRWLVDLGRDYPRTPQAGLSNADAKITLLFMEAASRVDPAPAEPYLWQYDMLAALDRPDAARQALEKYVSRRPDDISAHLNWIALELEALQTAEARAEFCRKHLDAANLPGKVASDLHRRLAEFHIGRGERELARKEALAAVEGYELNFAARQLLEVLQVPPGTQAPDRPELDELLLAVAASPNDPDLALHVADRLMEVELAEAAERFYGHAVDLLRIMDTQGQLAAVMTDRAVALRKLGRAGDADRMLDGAAEQWKALLAGNQGLLAPELTAQMAWFYAFHKPEPLQAEKLARVALAERPDSIVARRAMGSALRQLGKVEEARAELAPVADRDVAAAAEYAQVLAAANEPELARSVLGGATTRPADPTAQVAIGRAAAVVRFNLPASRPAPVEAAQALERFPWPVLDYPLHPDKYLAIELAMPQAEMPPAEPWILTARLKNIGSFPITIGPDMMVSPDLDVAVTTQGDRLRTTDPMLRFSFNRTPRLAPGESVEIRHTIDLGGIRSGMIGTPQVAQDVTVGAVLSPIALVSAEGQGVVGPDIGGLLAEPLKFRRVAFVPVDSNLRELVKEARSTDPLARIHALEVFAMLLAEHQHLKAKRLDYAARPIDAAAVQAAILSMAGDPDWHVRARLAEVLRWFGLDSKAVQVATRLLSDPHWLVRGLAMRALADHRGAEFQSVLSHAAQADPDPWVRRLTAALNDRIAIAAATTAASQPAAR